ncbi:MAG: hypothetical protein LBU04_03445 [Christensenellaceae bacterium]|jgi:hypothetical protein|nr:hypothetical protein [Christensenellaceae bacterium]
MKLISKKVLCLCVVGVFGNSLAMLPVMDENELEKAANAIVDSTSAYDKELDSEKFVSDLEQRKQVRLGIAKIEKIKGLDLYASYTISKNTFRRVMKAFNPDSDFIYYISESDEIAFCDRYFDLLTTKEAYRKCGSLDEPRLYPAYMYCHKNLVKLLCIAQADRYPGISQVADGLLPYVN